MAEPTTLSDQDNATPAAAPGLRRFFFPAVRVLFVLAVAVAVTYATVSQWRDVRETLLDLAWQSVVLSLLMALVGIAANTMAWRVALEDLEYKVSVGTAARIFLIGQLAKYLPGSVWALVMQMELGRRAGLPRARAFLASLVLTGLAVSTALVLGVFGLPALFDAAGKSEFDTSARVALYAVLGLVPIALVCTHPRVLTWLVQLFLRLIRRQPLRHVLTWSGVLRVVGWNTVAFVAFGMHLWLLANAQAAPGVSGLFQCIGAFALALTAGLFAFLAPSGIGVREAVIAAALVAYVPFGVALGIALVSRLIFTVADLIAAGAAGASAVGHLRRSRHA